jgi:hypothetical protein
MSPSNLLLFSRQLALNIAEVRYFWLDWTVAMQMKRLLSHLSILEIKQ